MASNGCSLVTKMFLYYRSIPTSASSCSVLHYDEVSLLRTLAYIDQRSLVNDRIRTVSALKLWKCEATIPGASHDLEALCSPKCQWYNVLRTAGYSRNAPGKILRRIRVSCSSEMLDSCTTFPIFAGKQDLTYSLVYRDMNERPCSRRPRPA